MMGIVGKMDLKGISEKINLPLDDVIAELKSMVGQNDGMRFWRTSQAVTSPPCTFCRPLSAGRCARICGGASAWRSPRAELTS